jgi:hypothetical protein
MNDGKNKNTDFSKLLKGLDNMWVILSRDNTKVIASSDDLDKIAEKLSEGILLKVPDSKSVYAPHFLPA